MPFRLVVAAIVFAALSQAQFEHLEQYSGPPSAIGAPNPNAKRYTVSGTVFNTLTGEPIRRALVHLNGPEAHVAFSGPDGRFEFQNIPEGRVWITAQRPGFFPPGNGRNSNFHVTSGSNDFRVPLTPEARITGTVSDSQGEPVEGIAVQIMRAQIMDGHRQWMPGGMASTDENGEYKLDDQMPGLVIVCTMARPLQYGPFSRNAAETYPARCYPNAPDAASAQPLNITAGQPLQADFTLDPAPGFRISGTVVGGNGNIGGWLESANGMPGMGLGINPRTHRFSLGPVPNGTWKMHFQSQNGSELLQTEEEVTVNGADVNGLQVVLAPGVDIPIEFVQAAGTAGGEQNAAVAPSPGNGALPVVRLYRPGGNVFFGNVPMAVPDPNNAPGAPPRQIIKSVSPGTYKVSVQPAGACLGSVTSGGVDLLEQPLTVAPGSTPAPIQVTLRNDCASLEVTLHSDHPENESTLLLVPDTPGIEARMMGLSGSTSFTFSDLSPGSYHVYAVTDASDLEYANPDAMRDLGGQSVTVDAGQKATVNLSVVERKK